MAAFWAFSWILIPIAGIMLGAFKEWLKFKEKQQQLGNSTEALETKLSLFQKELESMTQERDGLKQRIQNLEAIVTSPSWDALHEEKPALEAHEPLIEIPSPEEENVQRAEQLARRLSR